MTVNPDFPSKIWDGLTSNSQRVSRQTDQWCNHQDWHKITAEVIAIEEFLLSLGNPVETASLYTGEASEEVQGGQLVSVQGDGTIALANCQSEISPSGLVIVGGGVGETITYLRQGRITSSDWTIPTGSQFLTPGADYYMRCNGQISTDPPTDGFLNKVGQAQGQTIFDIDIQYSIRL